MKKPQLKRLIALAALAFLAGSTEQTRAQNAWTNAGASPGGGYIIIGNSAPTDLGQLSTSTSPVFLSSNGFNIITVEVGNTATASYAVDITNNNNVLNNHGTLTGSEYPVYIYGQNNIINNWGTVSSPNDPVWEEGTQHNTFNNWGMITNTASGDYDVYTDGGFFTLNNYASGIISGATYQAIYSNGNNFTFNNWGQFLTQDTSYGIYSSGLSFTLNNYSGGMISGSDISYFIYSIGNNFTFNNSGQFLTQGASYGIYSTAPSFLLNNYSGGVISGISDSYVIYSGGSNATVNNWGMLSGSSSGFTIYSSGASFVLNNYGGGVISGNDNSYPVYIGGGNALLNNWGAISCTDGDYTVALESNNNTLNNWGTISSTYDSILEDGSHNTVNNWGTGMITVAGDYGFLSYGGNFTLNNWGTISGATVDTVYLDGGNDLLNNWGMISTNGGNAILIDSSNNTINLRGHSSVVGPISVTAANNVVNLDFTGLSPATIKGLYAVLLPQGVNSGTATDVQFTLRNINYKIDPAIVNFNPSSYQMQGFTPNQAAIGVSLDSIAVNPAPGSPLANLFNAIDTSGNVPAALESLSPQKYEIYGDLAIQNATGMALSVDQRLDNLRDGSEGVDTTGLGGDNTAALTSGYSKDDSKDKSKETVQPEQQENRWGFFATGNGSFFRANSHNVDLVEGSADSVGTLAGVDGKIGEHAVIGALFAYNNSDVTLGGDGSHATIESYSGGLYGAYHQDGFYVNSLAAYTRNDYKSTRNINIPGSFNSAAGSTNGNQASVNIDGGYDWHVTNRLTAGPLVGLQYVHLDVDGFNETGAGAAGLAVNSQDVDSLQSRVGGRIDYHILAQPDVAFAADFHAAWQHEYLNDSRGIGASFEAAGLSPFSIQTQAPQRDAAVVGVGLNFTFKNRITLFAGYDLQYWKASYIDQTVNGGARISW